MNRQETLASLNSRNPEVLIIGAGINGVGTFRDLALNGVDVLMIDVNDLCSGASAASSHMAHGGIRYLENGEFRLVREAVRERNRMIENAPHLVHPLPTTIPIFKTFSGLLNAPLKFLGWLQKPSERGGLVIKIGLIFYDAFTRGQGTVPRHTFHMRKKALQMHPRLNPEILYAATYYDGSIFSPERFTVELLLDAEAEGGHARALNYVSVKEVEKGCVTLRDELSNATYPIQPKLIINAAGPWIDIVNRKLGLTTYYIGGTKGSHLVLDAPELRKAIGENEFFFENKDGRIVLIFPLGEKIIVGTSDLPSDDPNEARCTPQEDAYFMEMIERVFPGMKLVPEQIIFRFSGVRPLAFSQARNAGQITRDHHIQEDHLAGIPVYSLVGGKWTSFRAFSEQVTDRTLTFLKLERTKGTQALPIGGGRDYPLGAEARDRFIDKVCQASGFDKKKVALLFERYGTRCMDVAAHMVKELDRDLDSLPEFTCREIDFLVRVEKAVHLDDLVLRRTMLAYFGLLTRQRVDELAEVMGSVLDWNQRQKKYEVDRLLAILLDHHQVHPEPA